MTTRKSPLEIYLAEIAEIRATGAGTKETSYYPALEKLLSEAGRQLKPRVRCVMGLKNLGSGMPDGGSFTEDQFKRGSPQPATPQKPSRGASPRSCSFRKSSTPTIRRAATRHSPGSRPRSFQPRRRRLDSGQNAPI